jgi:hypothetical protein
MINHMFNNKGMNKIFDEKLIREQIFGLGKMIKNGNSIEEMYNFNDKYNGHNYINMGSF